MTPLDPTLRTAPFSTGALVLFNQERGVREPGAFLVITTLRSGARFASLGLQFAMNTEFSGIVMLKDGAASLDRAIIVRDEDIVSVELEPFISSAPEDPTPFGFAAFKPGVRA